MDVISLYGRYFLIWTHPPSHRVRQQPRPFEDDAVLAVWESEAAATREATRDAYSGVGVVGVGVNSATRTAIP